MLREGLFILETTRSSFRFLRKISRPSFRISSGGDGRKANCPSVKPFPFRSTKMYNVILKLQYLFFQAEFVPNGVSP